jgi:3-dehydro-4-phosphotetronate decarboxylase
VDLETAISQLREYGAECVRRGLVVASAGNISVLLDSDELVISRRACRLDRLAPNDLVRCALHDGGWEGDVRPSMETPMHRAIYLAQPEARAILHSSAFYTTLVACSDIELRVDLIPEGMAYLDNVGRVPYLHPGTAELAQAAGDQAVHNVIILDNHGLLVWGRTLDEVVMVSELMERLCQTLVFAKLGAGAFALRWLGPEVQQDFDRIRYGRRAAH